MEDETSMSCSGGSYEKMACTRRRRLVQNYYFQWPVGAADVAILLLSSSCCSSSPHVAPTVPWHARMAVQLKSSSPPSKQHRNYCLSRDELYSGCAETVPRVLLWSTPSAKGSAARADDLFEEHTCGPVGCTEQSWLY